MNVTLTEYEIFITYCKSFTKNIPRIDNVTDQNALVDSFGHGATHGDPALCVVGFVSLENDMVLTNNG